MDDLLLQKYLRNETSEEELAEVLDWLDASTENQRYLDRLDYISNLNILAGEAQPRVSRRTVSLWKRTAQWSAAAAAALLVCAGVSHYLADRILEYRTRDMMAITAPNGQSMSVTLSDGTTAVVFDGGCGYHSGAVVKKGERLSLQIIYKGKNEPKIDMLYKNETPTDWIKRAYRTVKKALQSI